MPIDFADISARLVPYIESIVADELPGGKRQGGEWVALNPTRADSRSGSFKVNIRTGVWSDFATGESGGDMISLYAYLHGVGQKEAAEALRDRYCGGARESRPKPAQKTESKRQKWTPVMPVPDDASEPPKAHYHYGRWSKVWWYHDAASRVIGGVCRFDRADDDKVVIPLTWCRGRDGKQEWQWRSFTVPRPLYGLDRLDAKPGALVLVVEGEKCADWGDAYLVEMAVISWPGGSKAVKKVDFTPLEGRDVYLWPDRDRAGCLAMLDVYEAIRGTAHSVVIVRPPDSKPKGWDIADAVDEGWTAAMLRSHIRGNMMSEEECRRAHEVARDEKRMETPDVGDAKTASNDHDDGGNGNGSGPEGDFAAPAPRFHFTDTGNARRLVHYYGNRVRYNDDPFGKWFIWDDVRWREDKTNRIYYYVDRVVADIYKEASDSSDNDQRKALGKWGFKMEEMRRQRQMVAKAETLQDIVILADDLDRDNYLLNVRNCTIDLTSGEPVQREHRQADYITKLADVEYDPGADCPRWEAFLLDIFDNDLDLVQFIQRAVGYSLTGDTSEQCFFFAYGTGQNGKSVFFNTLGLLLGDYWGKAPTDMIMQQQFSQVPTDIADLKGKRLVVCSELADNRRMDEQRIKDLTGADNFLKARRMRENYFDFKPTHKLWMYGNHKPNIYGTDIGIWRRVRVIPFIVTIPDERKRPMVDMIAEFTAEMSGILNWALEGYMSYREKGLNETLAVTLATDEYRVEMDIVGRFINECCFISNSASVLATKFWQVYNGWCRNNGEHAMSSRRFNSKLRELGFDVSSGTANKTFVKGIAHTTEAELQIHDNEPNY